MTKHLRADLSLAFCSLLWGATFVVVKSALDYSSVFIFLAVRFTVAALLMLAFSSRALAQFSREDLFAELRLGCFMFLGYAFQTAGLQYMTAAKSGFVTGSSVVLVPLLLAVFWGRRLTRGAYTGALVAVFGLYYLTIPSEGLAYLNRGDVLTFVAAGLYAVHIILVGEYTRQHSATELSLVQVAACAVMSWVTACGRGDSLATGAIRMALEVGSGNFDLRGICHGGGVLHPAMGAAVHHAQSCGDFVYAGTSVCRIHILYLAQGAARRARCSRSAIRVDGNPDCRVARSARSAGIAGTNDRNCMKVEITPTSSAYLSSSWPSLRSAYKMRTPGKQPPNNFAK